MELIKQPSFETCGQACIAMITGKDINDVIRDMKTSGSTSIVLSSTLGAPDLSDIRQIK